MSADNYLYVRRHPKGGWTVTMEFASSQPGAVLDACTSFATPHAAMAWAEREEQDDYYEYGIAVEPETASDMESDAKEMYVAIEEVLKWAEGNGAIDLSVFSNLKRVWGGYV